MALRIGQKLLAPGKLPHPLLKKLLARLAPKNPEVLLGPSVGVDAAVVRLGGKVIAVTSDPVTLAGDLAAYYCVHVNANDLAVMGAVPKYMVVDCLCPPVPAGVISKMARELKRFTEPLGIAVIGGHTEITRAVNTPLLVATMFGPLLSRKVISAANARPGDLIVMTKTAGLEATAIIAREKSGPLVKHGFTLPQIKRMQNLLFRPGISIMREAGHALAAGCHAMHDATEGGILTALWEFAQAAKVRVEVDTGKIAIRPETVRACQIWNINPLRVISSGALLVTIPPVQISSLLKNLDRAKIPAAIIGTVKKGKPCLIDTDTGKSIPPSEDEIVKIYA